MIAFLLLFVGLLLIFLELYLPGAVLGIFGGILVIASIVFFAVQSHTVLPVILFIALSIILVSGVIWLGLWRIKHKGKGIYLNTDQEGYLASTFEKEFIGKSGVAISDLGPSGHILVEGKRLQAVSKTGYIEKGAEVIVIGGEGAHLVVKIKDLV